MMNKVLFASKLSPSRYVVYAYVIFMVCIIIALSLAAIGISLKILIGCFAGLVIFSILRAYYRLTACGLSYQQAQWYLQLANNQRCKVKLLPGSYVSRFYIQLNYRDMVRQKNYQLMLLPDSLPKDDFRRLRVILTHHSVMV